MTVPDAFIGIIIIIVHATRPPPVHQARGESCYSCMSSGIHFFFRFILYGVTRSRLSRKEFRRRTSFYYVQRITYTQAYDIYIFFYVWSNKKKKTKQTNRKRRSEKREFRSIFQRIRQMWKTIGDYG